MQGTLNPGPRPKVVCVVIFIYIYIHIYFYIYIRLTLTRPPPPPAEPTLNPTVETRIRSRLNLAIGAQRQVAETQI